MGSIGLIMVLSDAEINRRLARRIFLAVSADDGVRCKLVYTCPPGFADRHIAARTGRTESFDTRRLESDPPQPGVPRQRATPAACLVH
jgi:hypothetical protein